MRLDSLRPGVTVNGASNAVGPTATQPGLALLSIGTALPATVVTQDEALRIARSLCCRTDEQATWLPTMYGQTGIRTRHLVFSPALIRDVLDGTRHSGSVFLPTGRDDDRGPTTAQRMEHYADLAPPLAVAAARDALEKADLPGRRLTHLVTVSCTGFFAPGLDRALIGALGLAPTVQRTHVGYMGCHGALNGLRVADAFAAADRNARVLLCAVELCSLHYHYGWDPQKMVANALFGDGAAAVVGVPAGPGAAWRVAATGSCLVPDSADAMTWTISDHGFEMTLSRRVPGLIATHLRPWLEPWLADHGVLLGEVGSWAVHPGGPRILGAVEEGLALPPEATAASREVFARCGNISSPTVLFILDALRQRQAPRPCVLLGFGPGLMAEAVLFR
jgi:predicted naringenin-chalcone synthase